MCTLFQFSCKLTAIINRHVSFKYSFAALEVYFPEKMSNVFNEVNWKIGTSLRTYYSPPSKTYLICQFASSVKSSLLVPL